MRVPLSWLNEFAPVGADAAALAEALSGLGLVVEAIERIGDGLGDVIVAEVLATRPHPGADRVQLVDVDTGGSQRQIVCGAFNFAAGNLVALAPIGASLPGGMEISRRKVRGEWSEGMLCSTAELGLPGDASGIMILPGGAGLEGGPRPGQPLGEALGIGPDTIFDLDVTPNRPDALSVAGVARDLAAHLKVPFTFAMSGSIEADDLRPAASPLCPRFTVTELEVKVGLSPSWIVNRLLSVGMRSINNLVDISNYVMMELGQPNHPYDRDRLGGGGLSVRLGDVGERLTTLDGVSREVGPADCLIADSDGLAVGLAGIMGGASSEITESTTRVALEVASFDAGAIARTSKRLGLRTEASVRFERGVDFTGLERAIARFVELATAIGVTEKAGPIVEYRGEKAAPTQVRLRTKRVNTILGLALTENEIKDLIEPIGFECEPAGGEGNLSVTMPSWRPDCEREIDVIEEVGRHYGYRRIPRSLPAIAQVGRLTPYQRDRRRVRNLLAGAGISEAWTTTFCSPDDLARCGLSGAAVEVTNPLTAEESLLRPSLLTGLLGALATNFAHRNQAISLFEIGHVFGCPVNGEALPLEVENLALALAGRDAAEAVRVTMGLAQGLRLIDVELESAGAAGMHPARCGALRSGGELLGYVGEVDPAVVEAHQLVGRVGWLEVSLSALLNAPRRLASMRPVGRFPSADVDLAFEVEDGVAAGAVAAAMRLALGDALETVELFDVFRGEQVARGSRSLAWRLRFSALDHTLTETELATLRRQAITAVESTLGATLRGERSAATPDGE